MNFNRISFKEFPHALSRGIRGEHGSLSTSGPSVFLGEGDNPAHPSTDSISPHLSSEENKIENYRLQCKLKEGLSLSLLIPPSDVYWSLMLLRRNLRLT